ncbi:MAG: AcrR family transcriptional regulator [Halieaceae bacterium]
MARTGSRYALLLAARPFVKSSSHKGKLIPLNARNKPRQQRSIQRSREILEITASLLEKVGFDDLTTILIAKELGISVGTLYHYFPNKYAIMYAIAEQWLAEYSSALETMKDWDIEGRSLNWFCESSVELLSSVYESQRGIMPLISAITAVPELRALDESHDELVIKQLSIILKRLGIKRTAIERARVSFIMLEMTHALLVVSLEQSGKQKQGTLADIARMLTVLIDNSTTAAHR